MATQRTNNVFQWIPFRDAYCAQLTNVLKVKTCVIHSDGKKMKIILRVAIKVQV